MFNTNLKNLNIIKICYLLFVIVVLGLVVFESKDELHLQVNSYHSNFFDVFYKYITHLGDGIMFGILIPLLFFINKKSAIPMSLAGIFTLIFVHVFKKIVFKGTPRPIEYFGEGKLYLIEGVKMMHWNSFPSGHTTTAFAIATVLIFTTKNFYLQFLYLVLAILAGFSRVYLSQHFMIDILAGSVLGILVGLLALKVSELIFSRKSKS